MFADNNAYGEAKIDRNVGNTSRESKNKVRVCNTFFVFHLYIYPNQTLYEYGPSFFDSVGCIRELDLQNSKNTDDAIQINLPFLDNTLCSKMHHNWSNRLCIFSKFLICDARLVILTELIRRFLSL